MYRDLYQRGASLLEFILATPIIMFIGLTTVQAGLIYHGKTTLNYATFEAARVGAVNHAQVDAMRTELGRRLAPLQGGDGSMERALVAIAKSSAVVKDVTTTHVQILNPTRAAFDDWGITGTELNQRVLPNSHLRHKSHSIGNSSGLSLRDANLLKIEVTHGVDLKVPVVSKLIARGMALIDTGNAYFYARGKFPLKSVATVRMQSEAWEDEVIAGGQLPVVPDTSDGDGTAVDGGGAIQGETGEDGEGSSSCDGGEFGLGSNPVMTDTEAYVNGQCSAVNPAYGPLGGVLASEVSGASGSDC